MSDMQEYRAYQIGPDGHIQKRIDLRCLMTARPKSMPSSW
jgi:hypothetical protein